MSLSSLLAAMPGAVSQGVMWGVMVLGVYITFRVLDVADLTVDGSFSLGSCTCAALVMGGVDPVLALLIAILAGLAAGFVTGFLHTVFEIPAILAGILTQIALYSINIRIMGRANLPMLKVETVIDRVTGWIPVNKTVASLILGVLIVAAVIGILYWFFGTEIGCALRATGNNEYMVRSLGASTKLMKLLGLMVSNGLVALSGALVAQSQGYGDVNSGTGAIVIGLASIVIGEVIFGKRFSFAYKLASVVVGSVIYRIVIAFVLQAGLSTDDLKLLTALVVAVALAIPTVVKKWKMKKLVSAPAVPNGEDKQP